MSISMLPSVSKMVKTFETVHLLPPSAEPEKFYQTGNQTEKERPWKTYKRLGTFLYQLYGGRER